MRVPGDRQFADLVQAAVTRVEFGLRPGRQRQPGLLLPIEHGRGVIAGGEASAVVLRRIKQRPPCHRQGRSGILRLPVGQDAR